MRQFPEKLRAAFSAPEIFRQARIVLLASTAVVLVTPERAIAATIDNDVTIDGVSESVDYSSETPGDLHVGETGNGSLTILNGGTVSNTWGFIGDSSGSTGTVTIMGQGSTWSNSQNLIVGNDGNGTLTIGPGGTVSNVSGSIAYDSGSGNTGSGTVTVMGQGATWTNSQDLNIGERGNGTLSIVEGGTVSSANGYVATNSGSTGTVTVTGAGATWTNTHSLYVGYSGNGTLTIQDHGTVSNINGYIGYYSGHIGEEDESNGIVTVTGTGSTWTNTGTLHIGYEGDGELFIEKGGTVINQDGFIGRTTGGSGGVTVSDEGSTWTNNGTLSIGGSTYGRLIITNGGTVSNIDGLIGYDSSGNGIVAVTGAGSTWTNSGDLYIGQIAKGEVTIAEGGTVSNQTGYIGYNSDSTGAVTVRGADAVWTNSQDLYVGYSGTAEMTVMEGGTVRSVNSYIGYNSTGNGSATVTGIGSSWINSGHLIIANSHTGSLTIEKGGTVSNTFSSIGNVSGSTGRVNVEGENSTWTHSEDIYIGESGSGELTIADGGSVTDVNGYIAYNSDSLGTVTIMDSGSTWTNSQDLNIGVSGSGRLIIESGGAVSSADGSIGYGSGSTGTVTVRGVNSTWTNSQELNIGVSGSGTLLITEGAEVTVGTENGGSYNGTVNIAEFSGSSGTLNIGASSGQSAALAGTLQAASLNFGSGNGTLVFNHTSANYTFLPAISGSGTINILAGTTGFSGNSSAFTGTTTVSGGALFVTGTLGGTILVEGGAFLGGTGTVGTSVSSVSIAGGAALSPGLSGSIGTLTLAGNLYLDSGSTYSTEIDSTGNGDKISSSGDVILNSGVTLAVLPMAVSSGASNYNSSTIYTIIEANEVIGQFGTVTENFAYLDASVTYSSNAVTLTLTRATTMDGDLLAFSDLAPTPNGKSAADAIEATGSGTLHSSILSLRNGETEQVFQQLSGQSHADMNSGLIKINLAVNNTVNARIRAVTGGVAASSVPVLGYGEEKKTVTDDRFAAFEKKEVPAGPDRFAVWANGFGSWGQAGATNGGSSSGMASAGMLVGGDAAITGDLRAGVFGGFSRSYFDDSNSKGNSGNYHAGAYAGTSWDALSFRTGLSYTWFDVGTKRSISTLNENVEGKYDAGSLNAFGEVSYRIETAYAAFEPFAGLSHTHMTTENFTETGGISALTIGSSTSDITSTTLGMRASADVYFGPVTASLHGSLGWLYAFGDIEATRTARFTTGSSFNVTGTPLDRNAALVETGADFSLSPSSTLGITYSGQFGKNAQEHGASAKLRLQF